MSPLYGVLLGETYSELNSVSKVVDNIKKIAHDRFVLTINVDDERGELTQRFMQDHQNQYQFFNDVWDQANQSRDKHIYDAQHIIKSVGFNTISCLNCEGIKSLFKGLVIHYLCTFYMIGKYKLAFERPQDEPLTIELPNIPNFDPSNLVEISDLMYGLTFTKMKKDFAFWNQPTSAPPPSQQQGQFKPKLLNALKSMTTPSKVRSTIITFSIPLSADPDILSPLPKSPTNAGSRSSRPLESSSEQVLEKDLLDYPPPTFPEKLDFCSDNCVNDIRNFFQYVLDNNPIEEMREEISFSLKIFNYFLSEKERIEKYVKQGKDDLETEFKDTVLRKHQNEMEKFSENLQHLLEKGDTGVPIFKYDTSDITGDLLDLVNIAGGVPNPDYPRYLNKEKMTKFLDASAIMSKHFLGIDDIKMIADQANFSQEEKAELELIVRMSTNPDFIEAGPLCEIICDTDVVPPRKRPNSALY